MRRHPLSIALFVSMVLGLWVGLHVYAHARLVSAPALPQPWDWLASGVVTAGALSVLPAFARTLPRPLGGWVHLGAFSWMGAIFLIDVLLGAGDMLRLSLGSLLPSLAGGGVTAARAQAAATAMVGVPLVGLAVWNARRSPPLRQVDISPEGWPRTLDGLTVVQLSDVHVSPDTKPEEVAALVARVNAEQPDLVVLTGDLVDGSPRQLRDAMEPLAGLRARLGVYAVTGNHEYFSGGDRWIEELRSLGMRVLHNEHVVLRAHDGAFVLAGVPDWTGGGFGAAHQPRLDVALAGRDPALPVMLLAHQPRQFPEAAQQGVALQLSGHTHGGQLWPFTLLVGLAERYVAGLHRVGSSQLYVSRGTRYWGPPMRLGAPHELTLLRLRAG